MSINLKNDMSAEERMNELIQDIQLVCKIGDIPIKYDADPKQEYVLLNFYADYNPKKDIIENLKKIHSIRLPDIDAGVSHKAWKAGIFNFSEEYVKSIGIDLEVYSFYNVFYVFYVLYSIAGIEMLKSAELKPKNTIELCKTVKGIISITAGVEPDVSCGLYNYEALYARQYAYRMFPIVWNHIKNKYNHYFYFKEEKNNG